MSIRIKQSGQGPGQTIRTEYIPNRSIIRAETAEAYQGKRKRVDISSNPDLPPGMKNSDLNYHIFAAAKLCEREGWSSHFAVGRRDAGYLFVPLGVEYLTTTITTECAAPKANRRAPARRRPPARRRTYR